MKRFPIAVAVFLAVGWVLGTCCLSEEKATPKNLMKKKLDYSKNILDGLVTEDYETIIKNAKALNTMAEQRWQEKESPEYRTQNQVFWFTSGALIMAAEQKNLDSATLSYTQLTLSCVNCHKLLRRQ